MTAGRNHKDVWAAGDFYEPYVGRWSRLVARAFLEWLEVPDEKDWLDVGCGTGVLTRRLAQHEAVESVVGVDVAPSLLARARELAAGMENVSYRTADARALPFDEATFDVVVFDLEIPTQFRRDGAIA